MVSHSSKKVEAVFGEKNPYGVTSIELVKPYNLYTASGDGVLRIYDYQVLHTTQNYLLLTLLCSQFDFFCFFFFKESVYD